MEKKSATPSGFTGRQLMATILIACGVLLLGRNLGIFPNRIFHIIVSWPMLLVVLGAYSFLRRQAFTGVVLFAIGLCFILPRLGWLPACVVGMCGNRLFLSSAVQKKRKEDTE